YYRLCVVKLELPPLRERASDIIGLAEAFCRRFSTAYGLQRMSIATDAARALLPDHLPGHARGVGNSLWRAVVMSTGEEITSENLPEEFEGKPLQKTGAASSSDSITTPFTADLKKDRRDFEREYIARCLDRCGGNVTRAAEMLGMHRQSLQHK